MTKTLVALLDTDEVEQILRDMYTDEDEQETLERLLGCIEDGTIESYIRDTFETWAFENYWNVVDSAVMDWANDRARE